MALLAEDLVLLLLDDESGRLKASGQIRPTLGGALLLDLALMGAVTFDDSSTWKPAHVRADPAEAPPADPLLATALASIGPEERRANDLVYRLGKGVKDQVLERLVTNGQVRREEGRILGVLPRTTWPAADATHEAEVRRDLTAVLTTDTTPTPRTAALVALLYANGRIAKVVEHQGMSNGDLRARARVLNQGAWAEDHVRFALTGTVSAIAAVTAA